MPGEAARLGSALWLLLRDAVDVAASQQDLAALHRHHLAPGECTLKHFHGPAGCGSTQGRQSWGAELAVHGAVTARGSCLPRVGSAGGKSNRAAAACSPCICLSSLPSKGGHHHASVADVAVGVRGSHALASHPRLGAVQHLQARAPGRQQLLFQQSHGRAACACQRGSVAAQGADLECCSRFLPPCTCILACLHACGLLLGYVQGWWQRQLDYLQPASTVQR